ncbi:glycoside hydrolase family 43 protein [Sphingobacterium shayense]|uniref:glycoside hydrolase family 43 protein n=1 Tax=Sphingobacterium shayense TaxID=626343 RepID=UPI0015533D12|nr:glycoside hydrolase family 43 protein [Sphingobacterium shayense]NQD71927.1 glycoside hydrolase family 43 protein [Sphingobacterium shayense]
MLDKNYKTTTAIGKWSCILAFALLSACQGNGGKKTAASVADQHAPLFSNFKYTGDDQVYKENKLAEGEFYNPILQGCYPDPSITRKGNDYYLVNSSFVMFPGVPIFHSNDLVNWKQIGHVLDRETQLKVGEAGISEGIYAPDIMYNPNNDTFYMITTQIASGIGNMVVKTKDPKAGHWSDPVKLNFGGIDPALFFDDDGKAYVVHNDAPDEGKEQYKGHRVIKVWEYDIEKDQVIEGSSKIVVDGGVDLSKQPIWIEAPHIYKRNDKYYLMCAEGGTGANHSEVIFVSDHVSGPYIPAGQNPILSQRHLDKNRPNRVEWAGHADLVEGHTGEWYGVFLAVRPNNAQQVNTGRETFILPVDWSGEWPVFEGGMDPLKPTVRMPKGVKNLQHTDGYFPNGNFVFADALSAKELDDRWVALRGPRETFLQISDQGTYLRPYPVDISEKKPISALFYRQQHNTFSAEVQMSYSPRSQNDMAGLTCLQSERFNYVLGVTLLDEQPYIVLTRAENGQTKIIAKEQLSKTDLVGLKVSADGDKYQFSYAESGSAYKNIGSTVSGDILSTDVAGGFTGAMIGMYSTSANKSKL